MDIAGKTLMVLLIIVIAICIVILGVARHREAEIAKLKAEAVRRGFAEYVIEKEGNTPVFKWMDESQP